MRFNKLLLAAALTISFSWAAYGMEELEENEPWSLSGMRAELLRNLGQASQDLRQVFEGERHTYQHAYGYLNPIHQAELALAVLDQRDKQQKALFEYISVLYHNALIGDGVMDQFKETDLQALVHSQREKNEKPINHLSRVLDFNSAFIKECLGDTSKSFLDDCLGREVLKSLNDPLFANPSLEKVMPLIDKFAENETTIYDVCIRLMRLPKHSSDMMYNIFMSFHLDFPLLNDEGCHIASQLIDDVLMFHAKYLGEKAQGSVGEMGYDIDELIKKGNAYFAAL